MIDKQKNPYRESASTGNKNIILIEDIVRYLSHLASLHKDSRFGNTELSHCLKLLANALRPHAKKPMREISDVVNDGYPSKTRRKSSKKLKVELPPCLDALSESLIDQILDNRGYTKLQLIELGAQRFGISRSKLERLNKDRVIESIGAALNHERSLDVISQEARRVGENRSS